MSKRARFNGDADVRVVWPAGAVTPEGEAVVVPGGLLPSDAPAAVRDELLTRPDWSEVKSDTKSEEK